MDRNNKNTPAATSEPCALGFTKLQARREFLCAKVALPKESAQLQRWDWVAALLPRWKSLV